MGEMRKTRESIQGQRERERTEGEIKKRARQRDRPRDMTKDALGRGG